MMAKILPFSSPLPSIERRQRPPRGFSLVELMVAMSIFVLMLALVGRVVSDVRNTWSDAASRVTQFRDSRLAFELITRNIRQATLNTYFDYEYNATGTPERYVRKSELHFISGQTAPGTTGSLLSGVTNATHPGHGIFFQAYLGHTLDNNLDNLGSLLNGRGYYIQYTDGTELAPNFLGTNAPPRWRYRLWEWIPASEAGTEQSGNEIYTATGMVGNGWFDGKLGWSASGNDGRSRLVAENIIALLISPRNSLPEPGDQTSYHSAVSIAPNYSYDTRSHGPAPAFGPVPPQPSLQHLLPPLVQITLVAIDEPSAIRLESTSSNPSLPPNLIYNGTGSPFTVATDYESDLRELEQWLVDENLNYRVFSTTIALRGAKWDAGSFSQ